MSDMSDIIGYGGGNDDSQHIHYEATDSLHSTSFARVLDLISEGEILGLSKGLESVFLNGTPIQNADGTQNFGNVTIDFRPGTQVQDYIAGFPDVENEIGVGVELRSGTPWVHAISNLALSAIRLTLSVPQLSKSDTTNGDITGYKIDYQIELSKDGGAYAVVLTNSFNGKTTTAYQRSARIDLPPATTGWSVRVTRLTANANTAAIADTTNIVSYTDVIDAKLRYPMSALVGVQVDAKQFQNVPTRSYDMYGRIIQVPSNYNPATRVYTGVWDGTFQPAWTSNPAWIFRDLVLNDRYGLGTRITSAQIDKWALYAIGKYCDELVSNGKGGTEPRFTCNLYLQSQKAAYAVLQDMASIFRGISYWGGGSIMSSADMPVDPVYVYTAANVIGGKFARVGTSKKTRYTVALVSWNDPSDFYKAKVEYVEDSQGIARYGIQQVSMTAFGCTSQGQAQRAGRWALTTSRLETGTISFDVGMDGAIALPGQIVRVADPSRMGRRNGGRVRTAAGRVVTLDKAPTISAGDQLTIILPAGTSETRTVASVSGDAVTMASDWSALPVPQSVWSVDSTTLAAPLFKVLSVREKDAITYTIVATQHEPGKFAYVDSNTAIVTRPQTSLDVSKQAAPVSVTVAAYTVSLKDVQKLALAVSCAAVAGAVAYEGAYKRDAGNWIPMPRQSSPTFDVVDVLAGTYLAKIAAVNSVGVTSIETLSVATAVAKDGSAKNAAVILSASVPAFHLNTAGANDPASITFNAAMIALTGPVTFSIVGGTLTSITATSAVLTYGNMSGASATITASVTEFGQTYSDFCTITKMQDGANGTRGAGTFYAAGGSWLDATADAATPGANVTDDLVTIYNGTFAQTKRWNGSSWVMIGAIIDATLMTPASIDLTKFAAGIEPVTLVSSVPGAKSTSAIFNTTDSKLYRWNGSAYVTGTAAADVTGTLADAQIAALAASKVTGALSDAQITAIAAAKVTGQLSDTQIAGLAASKVTGQLSDAQLAAIAAAKITGQLSDTQIAAVAASKVTGTLSDAQITAIAAAKVTGQIVGTQITDGAISTAKLAAGAVTANEIAAGAIVASKIAADSVTAGKIAAAAISAREIAAGAVRAGSLAIGSFDNILPDPAFSDLAFWNRVGTTVGDYTAVTDSPWRTGKTLSLPANGGVPRSSDTAFFPTTPGATYLVEVQVYLTSDFAGYLSVFWNLPADGLISTGGPTNIGNWSTGSYPGWPVHFNTNTAKGVFTYSTIVTASASGLNNRSRVAIVDQITAGSCEIGSVSMTRVSDSTLIKDGAITTSKIVAGAITASELAAGSVTTAKLVANAVTANELAAGSVTTAKLVAGAVTANEIAADTITAAQIAASAITATELAAGSVVAGKIAAGAIVAADIAADTITAANIAANAITATELAADSVTAGKIAAAAISAREIAAGAVRAGSLAIGSFDNILPDPQFYDLAWWGRATASVGDYLTASSSPWKGGRTLSIGANASIVRTTTSQWFSATPGASYLTEMQVYVSPGFSGNVSIFFQLEGDGLLSMGAPNLAPWVLGGFPGWPIQFDGAASNTFNSYSAVVNASAAVKNVRARMVIIDNISAGSVEFGSVNIVRVSDSTLIKDGAIITSKILAGAVTADKITVTNLAAINAELGNAVISTTGSLRSGQSAYDTGTGWWQGFVSGVPKWSIGVGGGASIKWDGSNVSVTGDVLINGVAASTVTSGAASGAAADTKLTNPPVASSPSNISISPTTVVATVGNRTASVSGGTAPIQYLWALENTVEPDPGYGIVIDSGSTSATVYLKAYSTGAAEDYSCIARCTFRDASGLTGSCSFSVNVNFL